MRIDQAEALWLDQQHELSLMEMLALSGLTAAELQQLVACEILLPLTAVELAAESSFSEARFSGESLAQARIASRLRTAFDLDADALALTLRLLNRIHELETELRHLRAQHPQ
jgi:chaperone modulatory protein CbpM